MELQSVKLNSFRRFADETELRTNGKLVAILGPNESGKTSLLAAISSIGNADPIAKSDLTRGKHVGDQDTVLSAKFRLNDDDLESARLTRPTWYVLSKAVSGARTHKFEPPVPKRDISSRSKLLSIILKVRGNNRLWGRIVQEHESAIDIFDEVEALLGSKEETLEGEQIESLKKFAQFSGECASDTDPLYMRNLSSLVSSQIKTEEDETPSDYALKIIYARMPKILFFSNEDRMLQGSYDVDELSGTVPTALGNLCKIAKIDVDELISSIRDDDVSKIAEIESRANDELKARFAENWSQSAVHVALKVISNEIQILVREESYSFTKLAERSDGLRQFVALQSFTTCERAEDPILLIDEAEMRLHYDAQADLIQMLSKQTVSSKIIYTTHSAGCLPEDLGNGVRLVDSGDSNTRSVIKNHFWARDEGGLTPLLFGMGAATLAFFPIRRALLTEGESDMLLLPTMFREVLESDNLSFQIVPGLSKTSGINLPILARNGKGVAFALDFDDGGREIEKKIVGAGFSKDSIFFIRDKGLIDFQIEDFVNPRILAHAANAAFREIGIMKADIALSAVRGANRLASLRSHFGIKKNSGIPKVRMAYHILEYMVANPSEKLIDTKRRSAFEQFANKVSAYLNPSDPNDP